MYEARVDYSLAVSNAVKTTVINYFKHPSYWFYYLNSTISKAEASVSCKSLFIMQILSFFSSIYVISIQKVFHFTYCRTGLYLNCYSDFTRCDIVRKAFHKASVSPHVDSYSKSRLVIGYRSWETFCLCNGKKPCCHDSHLQQMKICPMMRERWHFCGEFLYFRLVRTQYSLFVSEK